MLNDTTPTRYGWKGQACPARTGVTQLKSTHQGGVAQNGIVKGIVAQGQRDSVPVFERTGAKK
jgi:hypothetical protein